MAQNAVMEEAILAAPDDDSRWAVYADWLQGEGDPRGELGAVQLARVTASGAEREKLVAAETALLEKHGDELLPELVRAEISAHAAAEPSGGNEWVQRDWERGRILVGWRGGFISSLRLRRRDSSNDAASLEAIAAAVLSHPSARLLYSLEVGPLNHGDEYNYHGVVSTIIEAAPSALRYLFLADFEMEDSELSWSYLGPLGALWKAAPALEHVILRAGSFEIEDIDLPAAKTFAVRTGGLSAANIEAIGAAAWPSLEKLELWFGSDNYGAGGNAALLAPILAGEKLPKLTSLGLMNSEFADELCEVLPGSPIAKRIRRLDLSMSTLTDEGATSLAARAGAFPALEELCVSDCYLTEAGLARLARLAKVVEAEGEQRQPYEWGEGELRRFASVGE